jgi:hypothetical protein
MRGDQADTRPVLFPPHGPYSRPRFPFLRSPRFARLAPPQPWNVTGRMRGIVTRGAGVRGTWEVTRLAEAHSLLGPQCDRLQHPTSGWSNLSGPGEGSRLSSGPEVVELPEA